MQPMMSDTTTADEGVYYTASVVVPIILPKKKAFVPTFQSCLIARIYSLDLSLSFHPVGKTVLTPTLSLRVPIQITSQPKLSESSKSESGVALTQAELDELSQARIVTLPTAEGVVEGAPTSAPPAYSVTSSTSPLNIDI
jgi:hypothetical protein